MSAPSDTTVTVGTNTDNVIQNFQLDESSLRGRMVRLGSELDDLVYAHQYPECVSQLVCETLALAAALSSMLKFEGIFTLQIQSKGPVTMLVADITSEGGVRACANFQDDFLEQLSKLEEGGAALDLNTLMGSGHMAFTVDQGPDIERHQAIVELNGSCLQECVQHYFNQSGQLGAGIKMACGRTDKKWRASVILLQHMPEESLNPEAGSGNFVEDDWRRTMVLLETCKEDELLSPDLDSQELLFRLFHEEGLRVFEPQYMKKSCRCSKEKLIDAIRMMPEDDLAHIFEDENASIKCEFCSHEYILNRNEL